MDFSPSKLESISREFSDIVDGGLVKTAIIRKLPNGKWTVMSLNGKPLGEYDTKSQAVKRLRQIEYFKNHKKKASSEPGYSTIMRELNKNDEQDKMSTFQTVFKGTFDDAYMNGDEHPEEVALDKAMKAIASPSYPETLSKAASAIEMGDPLYAGKYLAELIKFIMRRISSEKRQHSLDNLKKKIYYMNEYDMASKKAPNSAAIGTSIVLLKHILLGHSPTYIRNILNNIVRNL